MVSNTKHVFTVFLASPGDLQPERGRVKVNIDEFNVTIGRHFGYYIELLGWEDTLPGAYRPQSKINEDVDRCELFIGVLWRRWGEPPGGGEFTSGFEEEFARAMRRQE